ncbi:MAG: class I SAM-dependent methyltransferase [Nitrospirae bacterium]|nr:class I SAM-dependent methyltransferase [Nitrospirota bacterium]
MADSRQELVQRLFAGTGETYDSMVYFGTFGCDKFWKKKILAKVPPSARRVMDLACGTGIVTFAIAQKLPDCHVIGVDITQEYLDIARAKAKELHLTNAKFLHQRAEEVSFKELFDCVTASYLPKYADLKTLTRNVKGMLKENGLFIMHDFTYPNNPLIALLWEFYFKLLQTVVSRFYPQWRTIFHELPQVVHNSTWLADFIASLRQCGFTQITVERLIVGSAAIVTGKNGKSKDPGPTG